MPDIEWLWKYFPELDHHAISRFGSAVELYSLWNSKINVVSRKDIDQLALHHVLHSLSIAKIFKFRDGTSVLDAGTGGGFPGIPLAIYFPKVQFTLVDSIAKKIKVVENISRELGLDNVIALNKRFESVTTRHDFVTGRAVSNISQFVSMVSPLLKKKGINAFPNGVIYLTGGDIEQDLPRDRSSFDVYALSELFTEPWFETKKLIHLY